MNKSENSIRQPYEVIETLEETITRYFNPNSKDATFCTTEHFSQKNNQHEYPERNRCEQDDSDPKIVLRNCQFQALFERFNKLRSIMSEITQRFNEIDFIKAQVNNNVSTFNGVHKNSNKDFSSNTGQETMVQDNRIELENGALPIKSFVNEVNENIKKCNSHVSVGSQPVPTETMSPTSNQFSDDGSTTRFMHSNKEYPFTHQCNSNKTEAALLKKSKELLINLIDKELDKTRSDQKTNHNKNSNGNVPVLYSNSVQKKMGCINKINEEIGVLKDLEGIDLTI